MVMHKSDAHTEAGEKPSPELMARLGAYIDEHVKGQLIDGAGLGPSSTRTRLRFRGGVSEIQGGTLEVDVRPLDDPEAAP